MKKLLPTLISLIVILVLSACASKRPYIKDTNHINQPISKDKIDAELYLIGDIGLENNDFGQENLIKMIKEQLSPDVDKQSVIFLGNSVSGDGIPDEETKEYAELSQNLSKCVKALTKSAKNVFFLPGNNEWSDGESYTVEAVQASERLIQGLDDGKNIFKPSKGCGEPKVVKVAKDLIMVLIDSQWLIQNDNSNERKKSSCEIDNNLEFVTYIQEIVARNKQKNIIFAMHHPVYSNGIVGGDYPLKDHLLPVPVVGTLITGVKKITGLPQQFGNPDYETFRSTMFTALANCEGCITVAGHDNNLQYFFKNQNHFVVSGSGSKVSYVRKGDGAEFSSMSQGFVKIVHTTDLELWMEFYGIDLANKKLTLLYRKMVDKKKPENYADKAVYKDKSEYPQRMTTHASDIYGNWRFLRGKFYRKAWKQDIGVPLLWLDEYAGGVKPVQQGGGFQTSSLRLENAEGTQFALRSVNKDVEKVVPLPLRNTVIQSMIQDGIAASHPYGAIVIPKLAAAAEIYHANPKVFYLPYQEALGDYNPTFAEGLYLLEERPGGNMEAHPDYGGAKKSISTLELAEKLTEDPKHKIDKEITLRSRLFDMWIGDWDRHEDQWRWAIFKSQDTTLYRPIPRDRDQAFFKNDGVLDYIASRPYFNPMLRRFKNNIDFFPGLLFSARYFDRTYLNDVKKEDFIAAAVALQGNLTDEVIDEAFLDWPESIKKLNAEEIKAILRVRRGKLQKYASDWYDYIYKTVSIPGTEKTDIFEVEYLPGNKLHVEVYHKNKKPENLKYKYTLDGKITKEVQLYGINKDDQFSIKGNHKSSIKLRIIGGSGEDVIVNESSNKDILVYDRPDGITVTGPYKSHIKDQKGINRYNRLDWQQNRMLKFPSLGFYTDEGFGFTYNVLWKTFGFRSDPFKSNNILNASFFPQNSAVVVNYAGYFPKALGKWDFQLNVFGVGPAFTQFYYGLGNNYIDFREDFPGVDDPNGSRFHIVSGTHVDLNPGFVQPIWKASTFTINPSFEYFNLDETDDAPRFYLTDAANLSPGVLEAKYYGGLRLEWNTQRLDSPVIPSRGFQFTMFSDYKLNLQNTDFSNLTLGSGLKAYIPFNQKQTVVLAMNIGGAYTFGDTEFFHRNYLGGNTGLRGFRNNRFAGEGVVYHSNDLRIKLAKGKGAFPLGLGIFGSFDYGRVWYGDEVNEVDGFHTSYGGGIFLTPLNLVGLRIGYFQGEGDDSTLVVGGALGF